MTLESLLQRDDIPEDVKREIELAIADQRKTEEDFLKTKTRLQFLLKSSPAIIFSCEPCGNFPTTFMSKNVKEITGYEAYEFIDNPSFWTNGIHPDDRQRSVDIFEGLVQSEHYSETYRFKHKNGSYLWMMDEASLIRDKQGNPIEIVGYWTDITKQKEAEEKLRTSEEKYRSLFENIPIGLYRSTPDHKFLAANPTFVKQVGLSSFKDLLSSDPDELATRRNYQRDRFLEEINVKGEVKGLEFELKNSDGTSIYIRENARAIKDSKGTIIYYEGSVEDITDRVLAEEALRESEEKYRTLIDNLSDIVIELDSEGNFTFISPQVVEILGYQPEEEIGKSGFDFIHPDDMEEALDLFQKVFTGEQIYSFEYRAKHKKGHYIPVSVSGRIIEKNDEIKLIGVLRDITEKKKTEEALKESEEKYRLLFESAPISIATSSLDGKAFTTNQKTFELLGYSIAELRKIDLRDTYVNPQDREKSLQQLLSSGSLKDWEVQRKRKDGSEFHAVLNAQVIEQKGDKVILSTMQDITQSKVAEEKLHRSEARYRMLFNESPISLWELDGSVVKQYIDNLMTSGIKDFREYFEIHPEEVMRVTNLVKILDINSATLKLYKAKRKEDLLQNNLSVVLGKESLIAFKELILLEAKQASEIETVNFTLDGDKIHVLVRLSIIPGYEETFERLIISVVDITHRIEMIKALRESEERLRAFMDSATDAFLLLDSELNIVEVNKNLTESWDLNKNELLGENIIELSDRAKFDSSGEYEERLSQLGDVLLTGENFDKEFIVIHPEYGEGYISVKAFKVGSGLGIISRDITLQKQAELVRRELEQRRENFIYMASHELRTPLTVISGYCDFLAKHDQFIDHNRRDKIISVMKSNINRLERLTEDVAQVAQIEKEQFQIYKKEFDLFGFLKKNLDHYIELLGDQFTFQSNIKEHSININADQHRLQQVLENVISNALKHTSKDKREITVNIELQGSNVHIYISDNGAGIDPEHLNSIFEQFVSYQTEYAAGGTGIGLYLSRKILEAHGGTITAQSTGEGHGSTFIIKLPI
ncbi:MAG: PAS domain S-box protein [Candidatus Hodarchaeales archaeon]|jgi:PAS domain S-box-containing protein